MQKSQQSIGNSYLKNWNPRYHQVRIDSSLHFSLKYYFIDIKIKKYVPVSANVGKAREIYPLLVKLEKLEYMKNHSNQEKSWERKIIEACDLENSDSESENNSKHSKQQQEMVEQKRRKLEKKSILQKLDTLLS